MTRGVPKSVKAVSEYKRFAPWPSWGLGQNGGVPDMKGGPSGFLWSLLHPRQNIKKWKIAPSPALATLSPVSDGNPFLPNSPVSIPRNTFLLFFRFYFIDVTSTFVYRRFNFYVPVWKLFTAGKWTDATVWIQRVTLSYGFSNRTLALMIMIKMIWWFCRSYFTHFSGVFRNVICKKSGTRGWLG